MTEPAGGNATHPSRRTLLAAAALMPAGWAGGAYATDAPEQESVDIGFVAVASCAPLVIAHEKKLFAKQGIKSGLVLQNGWSNAQNQLVNGETQASHLKFAQPLAAAIGMPSATIPPLIAPFTLSRNGSVFMAASPMKERLNFDPASWRSFTDGRRAKGDPVTIALPIGFGWHGLMYRYFFANAGIDADRDMKLITLPPALMVQNMRVGTMDACAMVEPWGERGVTEAVTFVAMYGYEMWPNHPVKSLGMRADWAERNPNTVQALLRAVQEAAVWCDNPDNRPELARILSARTYLNLPEKYILPPLLGQFDWGTGRKEIAPKNAISYAGDTTPQIRDAKWFLSQFRRWGMTAGTPDYDGVAQAVLRPDLHAEAMRDLGLPSPVQNTAILTLWDGVSLDPANPEAYARSFAVKNLEG